MNIRKARHIMGLNQTQLAKAIGVSRQSLSSAETGRTGSTLIENKVQTYMKEQGYSIEILLSESDLRNIYADLKTALFVVKDAMDKVEICL